MDISKISILFLLGGYLILGLSHIAFLPPWEGFDENAHFSYIQQIADTGSLPKPGSAKLSKNVDDYQQYAPMPYCYVPFFKKGEGYTYHSFFNAPLALIQKAYTEIHVPPEKVRKYQPGHMLNWQTQHPPLYYMLLAPVFKLTQGMALIDQIFWLRLLSYLFAWAALLITVIGGYRLSQAQGDKTRLASKPWLVIGTVCIPLLFPSWFPEMARIGNDSLCALWISLLWLLLIRVHTVGKTVPVALMMGLLLGLGCLTKAFFVPLSAGFIFFLLLHDTLSAGGSKRAALLQTFMVVLVMIAVSGWWYWGNWLEGRSLLGSNEMNVIGTSSGLLDLLRQHFAINSWLRGHAAMIVTLAWSCTWSFIRPAYIYMLPLAALVVFIALSYLWALRYHKIHSLEWAPVWCSLPVVLGLSYHVLLMIALTGEGRGTSGYYLLFMVPVIGTAVGLGLSSFWHKAFFRITAILLGMYAVCFAVVISWAQFMLFAGLFGASPDNRFYRIPATLPPYFGFPEAVANLSILAYPKLGIACWLVGGLLVATGLIWGGRTIVASTAAK